MKRLNTMTETVDPKSLKAMLNDGAELALLDMREEGEFGVAHMLYAIPLPYSTLEMRLGVLVPRRTTRTVLIDAGDDVGTRAAARMAALGYTDVAVLGGGMKAWEASGYEVFMGVNVLCKAFGEVVEHAAHTPSISPEELNAMQNSGEKVVILDGRTPAEFNRMSIPGGVNVPNAELVYRIHDFVPKRETTVVVNCAGRTRSIIGAQTLINALIPNKVVALRGGTKGWRLAGFELDHGSDRSYGSLSDTARNKAMAYGDAMKAHWGVKTIDRLKLENWRAEEDRTTYFLDVRSQDEYEAGHMPGSTFAPGGQLVQATDQWCGTKGARIVLLDDETNVRAVTTAHWLVQMGWNANVLDGGIGTDGTEIGMPKAPTLGLDQLVLEEMDCAAVAAGLAAGTLALAETDVSAEYLESRLPGATWGVSPRAQTLLDTMSDAPKIVLYSMHETRARLIAFDLQAMTDKPIAILSGGRERWGQEGRPIEPTPKNALKTEDRIDFLFWVHDRDLGNDQAARDYLSWEEQLPVQIEADGDATYNIITH
jgi:rhodanese-related sulfurtransferase